MAQIGGIGGVWVTCCRGGCALPFWLPESLNAEATARPGPNGISFYCPRGHGQHWKSKAETDLEAQLRRERDQALQRIAQRDDALRDERARLDREREQHQHTKRQLAGRKGVVTLLKKRAAAGKCPCCSRRFTDLHAHMNDQHPNYAEPKGATAA